jgi:hypothetical protein
MLDVIALYMTVQILGGAHPEVKMMPGNFMTLGQCDKLAEIRNSMAPEVKYDKGRPILQEYVECVAVTDLALEQANQVMSGK